MFQIKQAFQIAIILSIYKIRISLEFKLPSNDLKYQQNLKGESRVSMINLPHSRNLGTCPNNCPQCNSGSGFCQMCGQNRVIPICLCKQGYYDDSGTCKPCLANCQSCSSAASCNQCYPQYYLANASTCLCKNDKSQFIWSLISYFAFQNSIEICEIDQNLYYSTKLRDNLQSIVIIFSSDIRISQNENNVSQFQESEDNCSIITDAEQRVNYALKGAVAINPGTCYIPINQQNKFILTPGQSAKTIIIGTSVPIVNKDNIFMYVDKKILAVTNIITSEQSLNIDINEITQQVCYFDQGISQGKHDTLFQQKINLQHLSYPSQITPDQKPITVDPQQTFVASSTGAQFLTVSDGQMSAVFNSAVIELYCTGLFKISTVDTIKILKVTTYDQKIKIEVDQAPTFSYMNSDCIITVYYYKTDKTEANLNDMKLSIVGYPSNIIENYSEEFVNAKKSVQFKIPAYTVKNEQQIVLKMTAVNQLNTISTVYYHTIDYISKFQVTIKENFSKFTRSNELQLTGTITDFDSQTQDLNQFLIEWKCNLLFDNGEVTEPCLDSNQKEMIFSPSNNLKVASNTLNANQKYKFSLKVSRKNYFSSKLYASITFDTVDSIEAAVELSADSYNKMKKVNQQDILLAEITYENFPTKEISQFIIILDDGIITPQQIKSISPYISFIIEDYFPTLSFTQNQAVIKLSITAQFNSTEKKSKLDYTIVVRQPPQLCKLAVSTFNNPQDQPVDRGFQSIIDLATSDCQDITSLSFQYYVYLNKDEMDSEIYAPQNITRKMISGIQTINNKQTYLPPGDLILMVVVRGPLDIKANFTKSITLKDVDFDQQKFLTFINNEHTKAKSETKKNVQIFIYQMMLEAFIYYEDKDKSYNQMDDTNKIKLSIIESLSESSWSSEDNEIYFLSNAIKRKLKNTKLNISNQIASDLKSQNEQQISQLLKDISAKISSLTQQQKKQYQDIYIQIIYDYMTNINIVNKWDSSSNQNIIQQNQNAMQGISQLMIKNQDPIFVKTDGVQLQIEKLDYNQFTTKYLDGNSENPTNEQLGNTYYMLVQTWPETTPLYRDEVQQINLSYQSEKNSQEIQVLLKKTYPIKMPYILYETESVRRLLASKPYETTSSAFNIHFGEIQPEEKLTCTQRSSSGKWVSNSCKAKVQKIGDKRSISCSCSKPELTSIIADVEELFNNENVSDIFSDEGILRLFKLTNWYEYAPIWTIIGLQILLILLIIIGYKIDKKDGSNDLKEEFFRKKNDFISEVEYANRGTISTPKHKESKFMMIKNQRVHKNSQFSGNRSPQSFISTESKKQQDQNLLQSEQAALNEIEQTCEYQNDTKRYTIQDQQKQQNKKSLFSQAFEAHEIKQQKQDNHDDFKNQINLESKQAEQQDDYKPKNEQQFIKTVIPTENQLIMDTPTMFASQINSLPSNKEQHQYLVPDLINLIETQNNNITAEKQPIQEAQKIKIENINQNQIAINSNDFYNSEKEEEKEKKNKKEKREKLLLLQAKGQVQELLEQEKTVIGVFLFHNFFSTFLIYNKKFSRPLRFILYYNKLVWLLTINSIFGQNISVLQVIILSVITSILLTIITLLITFLFRRQKLQKIGLVIATLFLLFCYYSILVVVSGEEAYEANKWIGTYFATFFVNELLIGVFVSILMYFISKKYISKVENSFLLQAIGLGFLLQSFQT